MQISETNISYNNTAVLIGGSSHYEITYEKRDYEGINKIEKIEDVPNIKIVFNQLTLALLNWLKASERNTVSIGTGLVRFWNKTGEANGIYQVHFTCDEFKQTVTLFLYQKSAEPKTGALNVGSLLELGMVLMHPFGRGNFKVGGVTVPIVRSLAEKNISTDIQKYKFADGWQYFITDKTTFNIKIYDLTTGSSPLISQLEAIKNQMVKFIPHAENPAVEYQNAYLDFEKKEVDGRFTVEVSLQLVSEINNLNFVYPPIINRIGKITISAMATSQICYTYSATGTPAQPTPDNWILYTPETDLAYGNYMIVAVENGVMSAVISEEFREQETVTISDLVKPLKPVISIENKLIVIEAESGAEIFYTENPYGLSQTPNQKNWTRYIDPLPVKSSNYKAIARKNYKNSDVAELTRSEIDSYLISTAKNEAVTAAVYTAASLANTAKSEAISAAEAKLSEMVGASPETLNTLNELATALGNDPNFATTTATEIGKKIDTTTATAAISAAKSEAIAESGTNSDAKVKIVSDIISHPTSGLSAAHTEIAKKAAQTDFTTLNETVNNSSTGLVKKIADAQAAINLKANSANPTFTGTVTGVTKAHVGLSNVTNTADSAKPVSTAQSTAITAAKNAAISAAATDATTKANNAKSEAITAAEATAATLAETAKSEAISAAASDATTKANNAKSAAETTAATALNNLQIGGRNIAVNSKLPIFYACNTNLGDSTTIIENGITFRRAVAVKTDSSGINPYGRVQIFHPTTLDYLKPNDDITLSIMVKQDSGRSIQVGLYAEIQNAFGYNDSVQSGIWTKIIATGKKLTNGLFAILLYTTDYNIIDYRNLKLELGSKATDWTPAPEDTTAEILTAKSEAISAAATDATTKANNAKTAAEATAATLAETAKSKAITAANETTAAVAARVDEVEQITSENSVNISTTLNKLTGLEKAVVFGQNKIVFGNQDWIDYVVNSAKSNFYYQAAYYGVVVKGEQTFCINAIMAIEPGSSYKVSVRARSLDGNTTIYAGVDTLNANKLTISTDQATPYNYGTANGAAVSGDSVTYTGYFSGYNAPAEANENKFDGGGCFFRVALCCNKGQATTFRTLIESVEIEKISVSRAVDIIQDDNRNFVSLVEKNRINSTHARLADLELVVQTLQATVASMESTGV